MISPTEFCSPALVNTWRFSKSTWLLDRQFTWKGRRGSFTLTHNSTKFDCHWRSETGDAPFCEYNVITWKMGHLTRSLWSSQLKSQFAKIGSHCPSKGIDKASLKKISPPHDQWVTWLGGRDTLNLNHKGYSKSNRPQR